MKEEVMNKIRKMAKGCRIAANIIRVLMIVATVFVLLAAVVCAIIPEKAMTIEVTEQSKVSFQIPQILLDSDDWDESMLLDQENISAGVTINDAALDPDSIVWNADTMEVQTVPTSYVITFGQIWKVLALAFLNMIAAIVSLSIFVGFLKKLETGESPFDNEVIRKMQHFAYSLIPCAVLEGITGSLAQMLMKNSATFVFSLTSVYVIVAILGLVQIFKYGAMLQQESDETL